MTIDIYSDIIIDISDLTYIKVEVAYHNSMPEDVSGTNETG